jgi:hypothetical protein
MLEITPDLGADWLLDLWELAPTRAKAKQLRESRVAKLLAMTRVRRINAAQTVKSCGAYRSRSLRARRRPPWLISARSANKPA